jgi:peptide deformylase
MALLEILKYPDPRLRELSQPVEKFTPELKKFAQDLLETMYGENGIGLAAPQVGNLVRMLVIDTRPRDTGGRYEENKMTELETKIYDKQQGPLVIINPEIVQGSGKTTFNEGCLSVPSFYEEVERHQEIELKYQDIDGKTHTVKVDGLLAICVQHEMDHLEGTLFIDHLSFIKSNKIKNQIKKHGYPEKNDDGDADAQAEKELEKLR